MMMMNWYTFHHQGEKIEIGANCWQAAFRMVQDLEDVATEPFGYWEERTYEPRTWVWRTRQH